MNLSVLFIGNSHTYLHYMPQMLVGLVKAADPGYDLAVEQCVGEGVSLEWHWNHEPTRQMMGGRKWDYIVLQDRSGGPLEDPDSFQNHARLFDAEIKKFGAKTIFYLTWANRDRPETQTLLTGGYSRMASELDSLLASVGIAWENAREINSSLVLHHQDGRHASPAGAYLTACVFFSVLNGTSPEGLPESFFIEGKNRPDQDRDQALLLQKVAWETVWNAEVGMRKSGYGSGKSECGRGKWETSSRLKVQS